MSDKNSKLTDAFEKFQEQYEAKQLEQLQNSWFMVDKPTKKHRLKTIIALVTELTEIRKVSGFSSAFGEMAIEAVICGDWKELEEVIGFQTFKGETPDIIEKHAPLWEKFRTIAETAIAENRCLGQVDKVH